MPFSVVVIEPETREYIRAHFTAIELNDLDAIIRFLMSDWRVGKPAGREDGGPLWYWYEEYGLGVLYRASGNRLLINYAIRRGEWEPA